jgi:dsDNA-binding SOS-regulon protein
MRWDAEKKVDDLYHQAETATEKYNGATEKEQTLQKLSEHLCRGAQPECEADYAALAQWLAEDRDILAEIRKRLAENRLTSPLFDTDLMRRNIEEAYTVTWARRSLGTRLGLARQLRPTEESPRPSLTRSIGFVSSSRSRGVNIAKMPR